MNNNQGQQGQQGSKTGQSNQWQKGQDKSGSSQRDASAPRDARGDKGSFQGQQPTRPDQGRTTGK